MLWDINLLMADAALAITDNFTTPIMELVSLGVESAKNGTLKQEDVSVNPDSSTSKEDAETAMKINITTPHYWLVSQDVEKIKIGSTENVNVFQDTIWFKENASFVVLMKSSILTCKDVFQTVEIMHFLFQAQEFVNVKKDFTEFKESVDCADWDKFMIHFFNVVQENKLFAMPIKFTAPQPKPVFALPVTTELMESALNVQWELIMMKL